jgi:hypothetical protein
MVGDLGSFDVDSIEDSFPFVNKTSETSTITAIRINLGLFSIVENIF